MAGKMRTFGTDRRTDRDGAGFIGPRCAGPINVRRILVSFRRKGPMYRNSSNLVRGQKIIIFGQPHYLIRKINYSGKTALN